ncbi:MAG: hypothetical protein ABS79_05475 [Planctomycetes bacterium SCN 63-9]|nr:MAG: hypothetical protein ABS79_05475 [Planctomycetes bacterium SCN 63-9]
MSPRKRCRWAIDFFASAPLPAMTRVLAALGLLIAGGCTLNKDQFRPEKVFTRIGSSSPPGQIIQPKRCQLEIAILTRPIGDKAINEVVWNVADVQCIPLETRRTLEANGMRIGKIIGALPPELESVLHAPPPHKVEPVTHVPEANQAIEVRTAEMVPQISLLMNRDDRAFAKDYDQAIGILRVGADHDGERGISLRMVPEIHYGPVKTGYQPIANAGAYPLNQMSITNSQQQDSLTDLAATTVLQPGEVAVFTCDTELDRSLGSFLFTFREANSDRRMQHLVMIKASRNQSGTIEAEKLHASSDRPKESRLFRLGPKPSEPAASDDSSKSADTPKDGVKKDDTPKDGAQDTKKDADSNRDDQIQDPV